MRLGTVTVRIALIAGTLSFGIAATPEPQPHTISGDYMIAHAAEYSGDWKTAGPLLVNIWQKSRDPDVLRQAFLISLGAGNIDQALYLAHEIQPSMAENGIATALLVSDAIKKNDLASATKLIGRLPNFGVNVPLKAILTAWIDAAHGNHGDAITALDGVKDFPSYRTLHSAMINEFSGDRRAADIDYTTLANDKPVPRIASIAADYYRRTDRPQMATSVIDGLLTKENIAALSVRAGEGATRAKPTIATGAAEGLYNMAELLLEADHPDIGLFYAAIASHLDPQKADTNLLTGEIEQAEGRHSQAAESFLAVPEKADFGLLARLDAASAFEEAHQPEKAIVILNELVKARPALPEPQIALGDLLRRQNQFAKSIDAYSKALSLTKSDDGLHADILFARAIAYDSLHDDKPAEDDLKTAVALAPDHATMLNYLGFFWASRNENLAQAQTMLSHAYRLAPTDGAIADSLGWVLYQSGDYKGAVTYLEQAVTLMPGDSEINGHLGDAYWRVGRATDARFQWRHALLNASTQNAPGFKTKLIDGLVDTQPAKPATTGESHAALDTPLQQ